MPEKGRPKGLVTAGKVLDILVDAGDYVSGESLCTTLGLSRTAVWKAVNSLRDDGYTIDAVTRRGYCLIRDYCPVMKKVFEDSLRTIRLGRHAEVLDEVDSTNTRLKKMAADPDLPDGTVVIARRQTQGRGRRGREWSSPKDSGIYMSFLLRPPIRPDKASMITILAALAHIRALKALDFDLGEGFRVKWPNDVLYHQKKLCGILTEMTMDMDQIQSVVVGAGTNLRPGAYPPELAGKATSLYELIRGYDPSVLAASVLNEFEPLYDQFLIEQDLEFIREEYNGVLANRGRLVKVLAAPGGTEYGLPEGVARGIDREGRLLIEEKDKTQKAIYAGEVSIRGMDGYI